MAEIDLSTQVHGRPGPPIDLAAIERDLNGLWQMPTLTGLRQTDVAPARTSVLNLVVYAGTRELARRSAQIIGQLATHHPSRAIIFDVARDDSAFAGDIDARVSTHCFAAAGERFAACFEEIQITVPRDSLDYLPSIIVPLALPDLPTALWWPGQPPFADRRFVRVVQTADRLIVDSLDFPRCALNLTRTAALARRLRGCPGVADLNWVRLMPWCRALTHCFDPGDSRWALDHVNQVRLEYGVAPGQRENEAQALLFLGWAAGRLGWHLERAESSAVAARRFVTRDPRGQRITVELARRTVPRRFNGYLLSAQVSAGDGRRDATFDVSRVGDELTTIRARSQFSDGVSYEQAMQAEPVALSKLLGHELERLGHEDFYEDALAEASHYAALMKSGGRA